MANGVKGCLPTSSGVKKGRYKSYTTGTYIKLIASVIQASPERMLTFKQIMQRLEPFVFGDRKSIENNIRVCLSSNSCFTKVPVDPQNPNPKKNYWKVDESGITPKMLRRHFNYIIDQFPAGQSLQKHQGNKHENVVVHQPLLPICNLREKKSEVKFTGPFSIESLLKSKRKVMHNAACQEERLHCKDVQPITIKRKNSYDSETTHFYSHNALKYEIGPLERSRVFTESYFGLSATPQISYDHRILRNSPLMHGSAGYVAW